MAHLSALFGQFHRIKRYGDRLRAIINPAVVDNFLILHITGSLILCPHAELHLFSCGIYRFRLKNIVCCAGEAVGYPLLQIVCRKLLQSHRHAVRQFKRSVDIYALCIGDQIRSVRCKFKFPFSFHTVRYPDPVISEPEVILL